MGTTFIYKNQHIHYLNLNYCSLQFLAKTFFLMMKILKF